MNSQRLVRKVMEAKRHEIALNKLKRLADKKAKHGRNVLLDKLERINSGTVLKHKEYARENNH